MQEKHSYSSLKYYAKYCFVLLAFVLISLISVSTNVHAIVQNPKPEAKISFTFDDGLVSSLTDVAPVLAQYGYTGTSYVISNCAEGYTLPSKCPNADYANYMTWAQVKQLQDSYSWEIGSHSASHKLMSGLSASKIESEVANSKTAFENQGIKATAFASPYGDYSSTVQSVVAKYYTSHRGFADIGYNSWPYSDYLLKVQQVQYGVSVETVKSYIDQAVADGTWLILVFHDVRTNPTSTNPMDYQYSVTDLASIATYVSQLNVNVTTITGGLVKSDKSDNLVTDPVAGTSIGNGWSTDQPTRVSINNAFKGSVPEPKSSIAVKPNTSTSVHLFSSPVAITPQDTYVIKGYVNIATKKSGDIGCYIDEYDLAGNWISGQYLYTKQDSFDGAVTFTYAPSATVVVSTSLQIIAIAGTNNTAYIDNVVFQKI